MNPDAPRWKPEPVHYPPKSGQRKQPTPVTVNRLGHLLRGPGGQNWPYGPRPHARTRFETLRERATRSKYKPGAKPVPEVVADHCPDCGAGPYKGYRGLKSHQAKKHGS